jgi:type II secretory pathway predicted ATPase ExeA
MNEASLADTHSDIRVEHVHLVPFISSCYHSALQQLAQAYEEFRPAAILISKGQFGPRLVIDSFVNGLDETATVVRIHGSYTESAKFMHDIVRSAGFIANGTNLVDLENILDMFLRYQKKHEFRTVITIEDMDAHGWWILDKIRRLVEDESNESFGLTIILSGLPSMISMLNEPGLNIIAEQAGNRIVLVPFTLEETRQFCRQLAASAGPQPGRTTGDDSELIEYQAIDLIYELCQGVPDDVNKLCSKSLAMIKESGEKQVNMHIVKTASRLIGMPVTIAPEDEILPVLTNYDTLNQQEGRLVAKTKGEQDQEIQLGENCILIGRDQLCSIGIYGIRVSRFHALVAISDHGVQIVDLGSTNGTVVNGHKIRRCTLSDEDVISIGHTKITYMAGSEQLAWADDVERTGNFEIPVNIAELPINFVGEDARLIETSGPGEI